MRLSDKIAAIEERKRGQSGPSPKSAPSSSPPRSRDGAARSSRGWESSKRKVHEMVLTEVAPKVANASPDAVAGEVRAALDRILARQDVEVGPLERKKFVEEVLQDTLGFGPLDPLLSDTSISEIMCNAFDDIWVERKGRLEQVASSFTDDLQYRQVIEKIVAGVGRRIDEGSPMVDARLPDGSRVNAVIPPLAVRGAVLTIRKFAADPFKIHDLIRVGTFTEQLATVMQACVRGKLNILVSGGTGTGKTTNLNVLSSFIPDGERIITIEDAAELQLQQAHVVSLEARPSNAEGAGEVRIRDLVRNALRMRPDRIIVGEVRGGEALDMLQAMNTGHEGSMTTVHANSARDALSRLETMVLMAGFELPVRAIREQITSGLDLIMQLNRMPDGRRVVTSVTEVQGMEGDVVLLQDLFVYRAGSSLDGGKPSGGLVATGLRPKFIDKLSEHDVTIPPSAFGRDQGAGSESPPTPLRPRAGIRGMAARAGK